MSENEKSAFQITHEQYEALAVELFPMMVAFFESEVGKKMYSEHLNDKKQTSAA